MSNGDADGIVDDGTHTEHEDHPWTRMIPDHPPRTDTPTYVASRTVMNELVRTIPDFLFDSVGTVDAAGRKHYEDHHGGGLWLKDEDGWFLVRNLCGIEWSAQFCADPAKVDVLRRNAKRLYARFPEAVEELEIADLLEHEITTAEDVAAWTDSICNASVPYSRNEHQGTLPTAGGMHHYPAPVAEITFFKEQDFQLWVTDENGTPAAVTPVGERGSGDGRTEVIAAEPGSALAAEVGTAWHENRQVIFPDYHVASQAAFGDQYRKLAEGAVDEGDPLAQAAVRWEAERAEAGGGTASAD